MAASVGLSRERRRRSPGADETRRRRPEGRVATPVPGSHRDDLTARWSELATASANVFSTPEWARTWWRHFGSGDWHEPIPIRGAGGTVAALLPLVREQRRHLRLGRLLGHGVADELGPVTSPEQMSTAAEAIPALAADLDILLLERVPDPEPAARLPGQVLKRESSPAIRLADEGGWNAYLAHRSSNFRQQVRRRARRLTRGLGVTYRLSDDPGRLEHDLDALIALHRMRWRGRADAFAGRREAFHRELARLAQERGWLRLWLAEAEGRPVAAWYGYRFGGIDWFYQSGRDPAWSRSSVGAGLLEHTIRTAFSDGMREYRLLRGDESYKRRYATEDRHLLTLALPGTPVGQIAVRAAAAVARNRRGRRLLSSLVSPGTL